MATPIAMPKLGMTMAEGRVVEWPLPVGSRVEKGQLVLVIESEKTEIEVEAPVGGVLRYVYVEADATVPCGALLAAITGTAEEEFDAAAFRLEHDLPEAPVVVSSRGAASATPASRARGVRDAAPITPAARSVARRLGIDVASLTGSGPGGRVTKEDVEAVAAARGKANGSDRVRVAPGVALEVPTQGQGDLVLLLPGFGTDVSSFTRQVPVLAERFRVRGVNPRGVGRSDAPAADVYDVATAAADVAAVAEGPAHLIGASLGAAAAIEAALMFPDRVRTLTLITPFVEAAPRLIAVLDSWCRLAREASPEALAHALLPWLFSPSYLADTAARARTARGLATMLARVPAGTLERSFAGLKAWSGTRKADLGRLEAPTLVLTGGDDLLTPGGAEIAGAIPGAELRVVANAGHALALEAADAVNEAVLRHLDGR